MLSAHLKTVEEGKLYPFLSAECVSGTDMEKMYMMLLQVESGFALDAAVGVVKDADAAAIVDRVGRRMALALRSRWLRKREHLDLTTYTTI